LSKKTNWFIAACCFLLFAGLTGTSFGAIVYTVKAKDTIWKISKEFKVPVEAILKANSDLEDEKDLKAGMVLMIPEDSEDVVPIDNNTYSTHTLIVHGSGPQYQTPLEKNVNVMTVDGRTIKVPTYRPRTARVASPTRSYSSAGTGVSNEYNCSEAVHYRNKYKSKYSSRHMGMETGGNAIVRTAFRYMGVPYVFGGTTPSGFDCSGFIQYVYNQNGIKIPRMAHHQFYAGTPISKSQLRPGDLVFFETYTVGVSHCGIYIGNNNFIHASSKGAVRIDNLGEAYYTNRYRGAARY